MASPKLDAVNHFISVVNRTHDLIRSAAQPVSSNNSETEAIRGITRSQLDVVRAARKLVDTPSDPDADKAIGAVLLERIRRAVAVKSVEEWERAADAAIDAAHGGDKLAQEVLDWLDAVELVESLGSEVASRAEQQAQDTMMEGFRRAAAQTPGVDLRIEEVVNGALVREEHILGPEPGQGDRPGRGTGFMPASKTAVLGVEDDRMNVAIERLNHLQGRLVLQRHGLSSTAAPEAVRLSVVSRMLDEMDRDLEITLTLKDELPSPIGSLTPLHFPALRAQLLLLHQVTISEGSVYSRAKRGDPTAAAMLSQFIILADMLSFAEPYYLPSEHVRREATGERRPLPAESSFLVWHDDALLIGGDVRVLAWLFATDEHGDLYDVAHVITLLDGGVLEASWCNPQQGIGSPLARRISDYLRADMWQQQKPLRLPGTVDSAVWKKALVRSSTRVKSGALHGLKTLAPGVD